MPHVSRVKLNREVEKRLIDALDLVIAKLSQKDDVKKFLLALLTPTERLMLAKRLAIILLLKEGLKEAEVAQALHVTRVTVSRMQLFLEARGEGYQVAMHILQNEKAMREVRTMLKKLGGYAIRAAGGRVKPTII